VSGGRAVALEAGYGRRHRDAGNGETHLQASERRQSICDWYGREQGYDGLYVVDGAMAPSGCTAAANPAHIATSAEGCVESILSRDF